jgi:hypothetical protein|tara:strand:- start:375 stop:1148 length:774 start_codon:yes stop_codon:yes gene_type:complete
MTGWIMLWREILEDGWYQSLTEKQQLGWLHLLMLVNWKSSEYGCPKCGGYWQLPAGTTAKTDRTLSDEAGVGRSVMRGLLRKAIKKGCVSILEHRRCHTIYVINNWDKFQGSDPQTTHRRPTDDPQTTQEEEGKKGRREEVEPRKSPGEALQAARQLLRSILQWKPNHRLASKTKEQMRAWGEKQAKDLELLHRLDEVSWERIEAVISWLPTDDFQAKNCQSGAAIRRKWDTLEAESEREPRQQGATYGPQDPRGSY